MVRKEYEALGSIRPTESDEKVNGEQNKVAKGESLKRE